MKLPRLSRSDRALGQRGAAQCDFGGTPPATELPVPIVVRIGRVSKRPAWGWHWCTPQQLVRVVDRLLDTGHCIVDLADAARRIDSPPGAAGASPGSEAPELALLFEDPSLEFADLVWPVLQARSLSCALAIESARVGRRLRRRPVPWSGSTRLGWTELAAFATEGVHIVARGHAGVSHAQLPAELAFGDLLRCRREIEKRLGKAPATFLHGTQPGPEIVDLVRRAGFRLAIGSRAPRRAGSEWDLGSVSLRCSDRPTGWLRRLSALPAPTVRPTSVESGGVQSFSASAN